MQYLKRLLWNSLAAALLVAASTGAGHAENCHYESADGSTLTMDSPMDVSITVDGETTACTTFGGGAGVPVRGISCDDGWEGTIFFAPSTIDGKDADLAIVYNTVWYLRCR